MQNPATQSVRQAMEVDLSQKTSKLAKKLLSLSRGLELDFNEKDAENLQTELQKLNLLSPPRGMESFFARLLRINPSDTSRVTEISVGLEHLLGLGVKDENILIRHSDFSSPAAKNTLPFSVALENLRSAFNVGSILRTCENFGAESVHLLGYTPQSDSKPVRKTALGAEEFVETTSHRSLDSFLESTSRPIIGFETVEGSTNFFEANIPDRPIFLFGNERFGISTESLQKCDQIVHLPMQGRKNSMNVASSVAAALGFYCSRLLQ